MGEKINMKCSVFIAISADGDIADVDCMIMGRKCMEKISSFNLTPKQWPYGDKRTIVLSNTLTEPPANLKNKVEIYSGDITCLSEIFKIQEEYYAK